MIRFWLISIILFISGCSGSASLVESHRQDLVASMPEEWNYSALVILHDSLSIQMNTGLLGNNAKISVVRWVLVNQVNSIHFDPVFFTHNKFTQSKPSLSLSWFIPPRFDGGYLLTPMFQQQAGISEDNYITGNTIYSAGLPHYQKGMIIRYAYEYTQDRPEFLSSFPLVSGVPVLRRRVIFEAPSEILEVKASVKGTQLFTFDSIISSDGKITRKSWLFENQTPWLPTGTVHMEEWTPALHISIPSNGGKSSSWLEIGDEYLNQVKNYQPSNESFLKSISDNQTPEQIFNYVRQNIRYYSDSRGAHALFPRSSEYILQAGYGDCKEMSLLLMQLLRQSGHNAHLVLALANPERMQSFKDIPGLGNFDHMIVAIKDTLGNFLFLDPTNTWPRWDQTAWYLLHRNVLVLEQGNSQYLDVDSLSTCTSSMKSQNELFEENGTMKVRGTILFEGPVTYPIHEFLEITSKNESKMKLSAYLREQLGLEIYSLEILQDTVGLFKLKYVANIGSSWMPMQSPGFRLNNPTVMSPTQSNIDGIGLLGTYPLLQVDEWLLPPGTWSVEKSSLATVLGSAEWIVKGNRIIRTFQRNTEMLYTARELFESLSAINNNTAWKEN